MKTFAITIAVSLLTIFGVSPFVVGSESTFNGGCQGEWCEAGIGGGGNVFCCPQGACPEDGTKTCLQD